MAVPLPLPPTGVPFFDGLGRINPQWQNYLQSLEEALAINAAPIDAQYWVSTADSTLTNDRNLGALTTGYVYSTVAAGVAVPSSVATIPTTQGGTNLTSYTQGDLPYASAANVLAKLAKDTNATRYLSNTGTDNNPAWAQVDLTNGVTGDLPYASLAQGAALSVLGVTGNATADNASIAAGTDHQVLRRSGTAVAFGAVNLAQADAVTGQLLIANGGTGADNTTQTYTPTLTGVANVAASTAYACQYARVGSVVTVTGKVDIDPTAGATLTQLGMTLPIASNIGNDFECAGTAAAPAVAGYSAAILGDAGNNRAELDFTTGADVANRSWYFTFSYQVI